MLHLPLPPHRDAIGTRVTSLTRSDPAIDTHVDTVTMSDAVRIQRAGLEYVEVRGTIEGVGWGGNNGTQLRSHYSYKFPYVLRIPVSWNGTLVVFRHGSQGLLGWKRAEVVLRITQRQPGTSTNTAIEWSRMWPSTLLAGGPSSR